MNTKPADATDPNDAELPAAIREALSAHRAGNLASAADLYSGFLDDNPEHPMALQLLGLVHSQNGDYPAAIKLMHKSLTLFPEQPEVANNLGNAYRRSGQLDKAIESYRHATELHPRYADALRNQALCYLQMSMFDDARDSVQRLLKLNPDDAAAWLTMGNVYERQGDCAAAIPCYEKALELKPGYADAHHNIGVCLRKQNQPQQAVAHYRKAGELGLDRAELYRNLGNALIDDLDAGGAIRAYRQAIERNPVDLLGHQNLNSLLWQQNLHDEYLESYRAALQQHPDAVQLRLAYAMALNQKEAFEQSEAVLREGLHHSADASQLHSLLGLSLEGQHRWDDALRSHTAAVNAPDSVPDHRISFARALLASQRPDDALEQAMLGSVQMPFNQRALAYLGLCWRLLGDKRDAFLNDYDNMVRVYEVPVPKRFSSAEDFNAALASVLGRLHIGKMHPPEQTLRGGSQTSGDLFLRDDPEIVELVAGIRRCVSDYISQLPHHTQHPLLTRKSAEYEFPASWSVRLACSGYHTMHVHPLGWISSAYYVQVPPEVRDSDSDAGGIKFGEPDIELGEHGSASRLIKPEIGRLVLFPSYMWHGTVPFESGDPRMTVAFDVVPSGEARPPQP